MANNQINPKTGKRFAWEEEQRKLKAEDPDAINIEKQLALLKRQQKAMLSRERFMTFIKFTSPDPEDPNDVEKSKYKNAKHHDAIARVIEEVVEGNIPFLILTMPPRHGKSEQVSRRLPAWFIGRFPALNGVVATYNDDFASDFGKDVRSIVHSPQYKQIFPDVQLRRGGGASDRLQTVQGGQWSFVGRGGSLTGRGAHLLIIDDLIKDDKEAQSQAIRDQAWNWFTKVAMSRRMGKKLVIMTFTRWHADGMGPQPDVDAAPADGTDGQKRTVEENEKQLVAQLSREVRMDKKHHEKAFKRMKRDMQIAMWGASDEWRADNYTANIIGRHIKKKTAAPYAKNPKSVARRRETLDYAVWDENPGSLQVAFQTIQAGQMAVEQASAMSSMMPPDPMTGQTPMMEPQLPPGFMEAQALIEDFQQGYARRQQLEKYGKTLEILFSQSLREQKPLDFKTGMKQVVRRALTACVGYVELGFQREMGPRPGLTEQLADARARLDHLRNLTEQVGEGDILQTDGEMKELELSLADLQQQPEIVLREGLIVDYPQSTKVIPDRYTKYLEGFVGARRVTLEYDYSIDEVREIFQVDLSKSATKYTVGSGTTSAYEANNVLDEAIRNSSSLRRKYKVWQQTPFDLAETIKAQVAAQEAAAIADEVRSNAYAMEWGAW